MTTNIYSIGTQYWGKSLWGKSYWYNTYWKLIILPYPHRCFSFTVNTENRIYYIKD